jgi:hypothetical protein
MFLSQAPGMGLRLVMKIFDGDLDLLAAIVADPFFVV